MQSASSVNAMQTTFVYEQNQQLLVFPAAIYLEMRIYYLHKQSLEISYLPFLKSYWLSKVFLKYPLALSLTVGPAPQ